MRRLLAVLALVTLLAAPLRAADDPKAVEDFKALEAWIQGQNPKSKDEKAAFTAEYEKKLKAFLKDHADGGSPTLAVKRELARIHYLNKKYDDALALWEQLLVSKSDAYEQEARFGVVQNLIAKQDLVKARARLDAFMKDHPDEKALGELDSYIRQVEVAKTIKVGAVAPAFKAKTADGKELTLESLKGKVVLLDFWVSEVKTEKGDYRPSSSVKEIPQLKKLYDDLHEKGLEIVGIVPAERDPEAFKKFLDAAKIAWPHIMNEEGRPVARTYGMDNLPRRMLVGKDGKILALEAKPGALDLRGSALDKAVKAAVEGKPLPKKSADE